MERIRKIDLVVVHCSDSPDDRDIGLKEIDQWHKERGFKGPEVDGKIIHCGYHYVVRRNGLVEVGRPETAVGAHAYGFNSSSIGICWAGRTKIEPDQKSALLNLIRNILLRYELSVSQVRGHCELNHTKTCPNLDMWALRDELKPDSIRGLM